MSVAIDETRGHAAGAAVEVLSGGNEPVARVPAHLEVKAIRARLGLSQARFAARFGFTPGAVQNWGQAR